MNGVAGTSLPTWGFLTRNGIRQPNVSRLMRGSSGLTALGHDVEVVITRTRKKHGRMSVVVAA